MEELLMMCIYDAYSTPTGKPRKSTALAMMDYVAKTKGLQDVVNGGDRAEILNFKESDNG